MNLRSTANYKVIKDEEGRCYQFFCDLSGAYACTVKGVRADTPEEEMQIAWETEGRKHFNVCHKCGRFVSDVMYNADVLECVECAPWENVPNYCPKCGERLSNPEKNCPKCGAFLWYEGG